MRLFEILMLLVILPVLVWPLLPWRRPRWLDFMPLLAVVMMVLQLIWEGYRWQMLPAYVLVTVVFLVTVPRLRAAKTEDKKRSFWTAAGGVLGLLVWSVALALPYLLPVPQLPEVTGPYAIGTQTFHLIDESREEIYTADPADRREIMMQIWYPTVDGAPGETAAYLEDLSVMAPVIADRLGLPSFLLDHIDLVKVGATRGAPVLADEAPYPVLVFAHGLRGIRGQNTAMVRELASQGFVVATIDHTYGNAISVFPGGRIAFYSPDVLSGLGEPAHTSNLLVNVWADDIGFVLDQLALWNASAGNSFNAAFDLAKVGVFGHSTGGGAAVEFCGSDERCRAGAGLDAWLVPVSGEVVENGLEQPFLFLRADRWDFSDSGENFDIADGLLQGAATTSYMATIDGAAHYDFTDTPLLSPLTAQLDLSSDMDSEYVVNMMTNMVSAFFRQTLKNEGDNLVMGAMVYPEMRLVGNGR